MSRKQLPKYVGPFIGFNQQSYSVYLALPFDESQSKITCVFTSGSKHLEVESRTHNFDKEFGLRIFDLPDEIPFGTEVKYLFKRNGELIRDIDGLIFDDLHFKNIKQSEIKKIASVSCNNPFHFKETKSKRFNMWDKFYTEAIQADIELVILAGDQVYNDNLEKNMKNDINHSELRRKFIRNYLAYFGILSRKKLLARIPSIAMWDDHDITDGYGSRPEQFKSENSRKRWQEYFEVANECFSAFQAIRNPNNQFKKSHSTYLDILNTRIYLLDLRTHRDSSKGRLMSKDDFDDFRNSILGLPENIRNVTIVSPVIIARSSSCLDGGVRYFGKGLSYLRSLLLSTIGQLGRTDEYIRKAFRKTMVADLVDDLDDSLGSSKNRQDFKKIMEIITPPLSNGISFQFLSGDIHIGGSATLYIKSEEQVYEVPILVSSPIGYEPMSSFVEKLTTSKSRINLISTEEVNIYQLNNEYIAERNFLLMTFDEEFLQSSHHFEYSKVINQKYKINTNDLINTINVERKEITKKKDDTYGI
ncbi:alkaline phosphatase D family protein [Halobacteriovorax sp. RZ-2]|uniref:alkaline phosphatase D family protein n=1 Tax=unclassified Halobacteriovorax TaxID=2639665 RepID=UPI00371E08CC